MAVSISIHGDPNCSQGNLVPQTVEYMKPDLYKAAKEGDVEKFVRELEIEAEKLNLDTILNQMSPSVDKSVYERESEAKKLKLDTILNQESPSGDSVLHVAARYNGNEITKFVAHKLNSLITKPNIHGDTPLHVAVRAGQLETIETLINCAGPDVGKLLTITNKKGNTALHEAVMISNHQKVEFLVKKDSGPAYMENKEGESPLYLAVKLNEANLGKGEGKSCFKQRPNLDGADKKYGKEILTTLLEEIKVDADSCGKLKRKFPMHAAVKLQNLEILELIMSIKPGLMEFKDEKGRIPLHYAALIGYLEGVTHLFGKFNHATLVKDEDGCHPIHLACENGHVAVVDELLTWWPDPTEFLNTKGQNILHVAAANGKEDLVKFLIRPDHQPKLDVNKLVNEKDNDGNTPLHLATIRGQSFIVWSLARCKDETYFKIKNNEGQTAYDIAEQKSQRDDSQDSKDKKIVDKKNSKENDVTDEKNSPTNTKNSKESDSYDANKKIVDKKNSKEIVDEKKSTKDTKNSKEPDSFDAMMTLSVLHVLQLHASGYGSLIKNSVTVKSKLPSKDELKNRINTIMVVAALVASIAFAAVVQTPEHKSDSSDGHTTNAARDTLFKLFILWDTGALNCSILSAIVVSWAYLGDINISSIAVWAASGLLWYSLYMMAFAFSAAAVLVVIEDVIFMWVVVFFEIIFVLAHTIFSIPMIIPIRYKHVLIPYIYFLIFCLRYVLRRIYARFTRPKNAKRFCC